MSIQSEIQNIRAGLQAHLKRISDPPVQSPPKKKEVTTT